MRYTYRYRSFFWPAVLILAGIVALLVNTGQIPVDRLAQLVDLWPLILVVIGLELIVRRTVHGPTGDVAAALIVLLAIVGAAAYVTIAPGPAASRSLDASAELGSITEATAEIDAGASTITLSGSAEIGSDLYRAHIEYSGPKPEVRLDRSGAKLVVTQANTSFVPFQSRRFVLQLMLNPGVAWNLQLNSGATTSTINLAHVHVGSIVLNTGASRDEITLGQPSGTVPVDVNGGALTVHLHRPSGAKFSVDVSGGAVSLDADGHSFHAIGRVGYDTGELGADFYRIKVSGGACTVTVDTTTESP